MKQKFVLIAALVCGILAAIMARAWINSQNAETEAIRRELRGRAKEITVIAAARQLTKGTVIQIEDIGTKTIIADPLTLAHAVTREDVNQILNRRLIFTIDAGATILSTYVEGGERGVRGLAYDIRPGMRAVSISVSGASAVSGLVLPNDSVDVLGTFVFGASDDPRASELVTLTVLQNVAVLATGMETAKTLSPNRHNAGGYSTVTLEVTPREAEVLVFAQQMKGRLSLTLRNPSDVYYEREMPRIDFQKIESELKNLNDFRQTTIRGGKM